MNDSGECVVKTPARLDVYASDFLNSRPSLADIKQKRTKCDISLGIDNRNVIGCSPEVDLEDCDLYTRHIVVPEAEYSLIRDSKELRYPGAVIVVETNIPFVRNIATD